MAPNLVICLRHGEKPGDAEDPDKPVGSGGYGVDQCSRIDRHALTIRGWQRAGALAGTNLCRHLDAHEGSVTILVPRYDGDHTGHRAYQTVLPLAARFGVEPDPACEAGDVEKLTGKVLSLAGTVVVCWEHDALAELARGLAGDEKISWPKRRFDVLWLIRPGATAKGDRFAQEDQRLLAGDNGV
jgi:hypothetical protein